MSGLPNPCTDPLVRETMKGVRRALGVAPTQKKGITTATSRPPSPPSLPGWPAIATGSCSPLGFAGGFRQQHEPVFSR